MNSTPEVKTNIREEFKIVPTWVVVLGVIFFAAVQVLLLGVAFPSDPHSPPLPVQALLSLLAGSLAAVFTMLIGYVNRDAKRRGMSYKLWTLLVVIIPNAIGFIIYFVVRQPIRVPCPQCGAIVNPAFNFCPKCKFALHPACPECHRAIEVGATFCPYCAAELKGQITQMS